MSVDGVDDDLRVLFELYENTPRQGPGSVETTRRARGMLPPSLSINRVLDLGCGTGSSTLVLAQETDAHVTAVDIHPPFLKTLREEAAELGLSSRITTLSADMGDVEALSTDSGYDLLWAEGSAYSIGFENALKRWRTLLRPGGCLVVSELVWFAEQPDKRAVDFLFEEYPDIQQEATRVEQAKQIGYEVLATFRLPAEDWHAYYDGMAESLRAGMARYGEHSVLINAQRERDLYVACGADYGYVCMVLQT